MGVAFKRRWAARRTGAPRPDSRQGAHQTERYMVVLR